MGSSISRGAKSTGDDSSSFALVPHISNEIIVSEILTRLPLKSIIRFRCVCKSWKYLPSGDPDFVQSHLTHHLDLDSSSSLVFGCTHTLKSNLGLGGSVNGLVCVYYFFSRSITGVGIWNPATNQYKDIPVPPPERSTSVHSFGFSFGFGFDPIANDYKIIFVSITPDSPLVADVYSCNAGSWGEMTVKSTFLSRGIHVQHPTIVRARPYWYNRRANYPEHYYVTYFDIRDEVFRLLPGIKFADTGRQYKVMANIRDSLAVIAYDYPKTTSRLVDVYILDESCGSWSKNYTVGPITIPKYMSLLYCFRNGDLLFEGDKYIKLVGINPETHAVNRFGSGMCVYDYSCCELLGGYGCGYIESLVSIKGMYQMSNKKAKSEIVIIERSF